MKTAISTPQESPVFIPPTVPELLEVLEQKDHIIHEQQKLLKLLEERLRLSRQQRFGANSEKLSFQVDFFDEAELEVALSDIEAQLPEDNLPKKPRKKRKGFSDQLPRVRVELVLTDEEKAGASKTFFTKVKQELDIVPAQARVLEYWQEKAVFEHGGEQQIVAAQRTPHPLGKCIASVQLLAYILISKYADALPLYRLEKILTRRIEAARRGPGPVPRLDDQAHSRLVGRFGVTLGKALAPFEKSGVILR